MPETWELGAYGGDATAGYACLDDGVRMRLRVRWDRRARGESSVEAALNRYRRTVEKAGKSQVSFSLLDPEALPARFRKDKHAKPFRWEGADIGFGAVWYCPGCGSVVVLEVVFAAEKDDPKTAKQIIAGARCHRDDAERLWSVYGFAFRTPDSYNLSKPELQSGRLAFSFNGPDRSWLVVERWGLARQVLSRAPMEVWPQEWLKLRKLYPAQTTRQESAEVGGLPGVRFEAKARAKGLWARMGPARALEGLVWHRPEEDKVVAVVGVGFEDGMLERVAETVECR